MHPDLLHENLARTSETESPQNLLLHAEWRETSGLTTIAFHPNLRGCIQRLCPRCPPWRRQSRQSRPTHRNGAFIVQGFLGRLANARQGMDLARAVTNHQEGVPAQPCKVRIRHRQRRSNGNGRFNGIAPALLHFEACLAGQFVRAGHHAPFGLCQRRTRVAAASKAGTAGGQGHGGESQACGQYGASIDCHGVPLKEVMCELYINCITVSSTKPYS